jgi:hypothetical protein
MLWLGGGVVAIVVGIVGAVWYAGHRDVERSRAPVVVTVPPATELAPNRPTPQLFELRFDSLPSASVFAEGHSAELCRTPCAYKLDPSDGGPTDRRTFVLHADGYRDRPLVVDLASSQHDYAATLDQILPAAAGPDLPATSVAPTTTQTDKPEAAASAVSKPTTDNRKPKARHGKSKTEPSDDAGHAATGQPANAKPPDKASDKPADKIDPSDTLDPFHHRPT